MKTLIHQVQLASAAIRRQIDAIATAARAGEERFHEVPFHARQADRAAAWNVVRTAIMVR